MSELEQKAHDYFSGKNAPKEPQEDPLQKFREMQADELFRLAQNAQQGLVASLSLSSRPRTRFGDSGGGLSDADREALNRDITMHLLRGMPVIPVMPGKGGDGLGNIGTMATDGERILIALPMMAYFHDRPEEFVFCLLHEVMHVVLRHVDNFGGRGRPRCIAPVFRNGRATYPNDPAGKFVHEFWNLGMDAIINDMLVADKIGRMPSEFGIRFPDARLMTSEDAFSTIALLSCERLAEAMGIPTSAGEIRKEPDSETRVLAAETEYRRIYGEVSKMAQEIVKQMMGEQDNQSGQGQQQGQGQSGQGQGQQQGQGQSGQGQGQQQGQGQSGQGQEGQEQSGQGSGGMPRELADEIMRQVLEEILGKGAGSPIDNHDLAQEEYDKVAESVEKQGQGKYSDEIKSRIAQQVNEFARSNGLSPDDIRNLGIGTGHSFWGDLIGVADDFRKKKRSWDRAVRAALASCFEPNKEEGWNDYLRPHRKTGVMNRLWGRERKIIFPTKKKRYGRMTFAIDVSGSMSNGDVKKAVSEVLRMGHRMGEGHYITVIETDAQVCGKPQHFQIGETEYRKYVKKCLGQGPVKGGVTRSGHGGTQFKDAFDYIAGVKEDNTAVSAKERQEKARINAIQSDVVIVLTDGGIFDLDQLRKPRGKVIWLVINDSFNINEHDFPFGEVYKIKQLEPEKERGEEIER